MRNQALTGYLLHHKPYQESRALYHFFSQSHGMVHGVGKKGMPLFCPIQLFATGKRSLKTFSQVQPATLLSINAINTAPVNAPSHPQTTQAHTAQTPPTQAIQPHNQPHGQNLYAGFYLNEILWKLLEIEEPLAHLWQAYQHTLDCLQYPLDGQELRLILRQFERTLFAELGCPVSYDVDNDGQTIASDVLYQFIPDEGFAVFVPDSHSLSNTHSLLKDGLFTGTNIKLMASYQQNEQTTPLPHQAADTNSATSITQNTDIIKNISRLHRQIIDHLVDYQPLKSRQLWQAYHQYAG